MYCEHYTNYSEPPRIDPARLESLVAVCV